MKKMLVLSCALSCFSTSLFAANEQQDAYQKGYQAAQTNKNADAFIQGVLASTQDKRAVEPEARKETTHHRTTTHKETSVQNNTQNRSSNNDTYTNAEKKENVFLAVNKNVLGIIANPSGLQYKVLKAGLGRMPQADNTVKVSYEVRLISSDQVVERQTDYVLRVHKFMPGLAEGLQTMRERGKTRFFIPAHLAYGQAAIGNIPPNSPLIVDLELVKVE